MFELRRWVLLRKWREDGMWRRQVQHSDDGGIIIYVPSVSKLDIQHIDRRVIDGCLWYMRGRVLLLWRCKDSLRRWEVQ